MAGVVLTSASVVVVYLLLQKRIAESVLRAGLFGH